MARKIEFSLTGPQVAALEDRYGRRNSLEGLVTRAVKEVVALQNRSQSRPETAEGGSSVTQSTGVARALALFNTEGVVLQDREGREVTALEMSPDLHDHLLAQFNHDDVESFLVISSELSRKKDAGELGDNLPLA